MNLKGEIIILSNPGKIKFKRTDIDTSEIKPSEIIGQTAFSAISPGTETAAYSGKPPLRPGPAYPRLLGYCNVAEVLHIGGNIKSVKPGDFILTGESHRSLFSIPESGILAKLPREIDPKEATLAYLYNLGLNSLKTIELKPGLNVAVIGLGILGLATVEQAKNLRINALAFSNSAHKLKLAKKLGAKKVFLKSSSGKIEKIADLVVVTSNSWADWELALRLTKNNGTIAVLGFPGRGSGLPDFNPLETKYFYDKRITIIPAGLPHGLKTEKEISAAIKKNCAEILKLITAGKLHPKNLISGIYDYSEIDKAYKKLLAGDRKTVTFILKWPQGKF